MSEYLFANVLPVLDSLLLNRAEDRACLPVAVSQARILASRSETDCSDLRGSSWKTVCQSFISVIGVAGFLLKLAHLLLCREQSMRDDARKVFVAVSVAVGSRFLHQCIQALISALPMKGYMAHVLDHTLFSVRFPDDMKRWADKGLSLGSGNGWRAALCHRCGYGYALGASVD